MIPVLYRGKTVGSIPPVQIAPWRNHITFSICSPTPVDLFRNPPADPDSHPSIETIILTIADRDPHGTPLELHATSLPGLLRIPGFIPEDHALTDLTAHHLSRPKSVRPEPQPNPENFWGVRDVG